MSTELQVGDTVKVRFPATGRFRPVKISKIRKKNLDVKWEDGTVQTISFDEIKSDGPKTEAAEIVQEAPKKRGRKPKTETVSEEPKKRGRKPKTEAAEIVQEAPKKRGRKSKTEAAEIVQEAPKKRGRKSKTEAAEIVQEAPKKRGRKPKTETVSEEPKKGKKGKKLKATTEDAPKSKRGSALSDNRATPIKDKDDIFVLAGQWSPKTRPNHHAAGHFHQKDRALVESAMSGLKGKWRIIEVTPETRKTALAIKQGRIFESGAINVLSTSAPLIASLGETPKKLKKEKMKLAAYKGSSKKA